MEGKKKILLKLTGNIFFASGCTKPNPQLANTIADQIKALSTTHQFGIVIGGGNFFRGDQQGVQLNVRPAVGHYVGMLATVMNGLILKDLFEQRGVQATVVSAITCPGAATFVRPDTVDGALKQGNVIIFAGGTGAPFFTTDTNAIVRALQMGADEVWKATGVDGIYTADPVVDATAQLIKTISHAQALEQNIHVMDAAAFALAAEYNLPIRVFNIFSEQALQQAAKQKVFGSTVR